MTRGHVAVIDIGKTNAKLALVDMADLSEITVVTRPNKVLPGPPWPHFDLDGHWDFLLDALAEFHRAHGVDAISVTTHGASAVLLAEDGSLAAPMLDYEHAGPDDCAAEYDVLRPPFAETGAPRLRMGLNLGAQLFWQFRTLPGLKERTRTIVTYPQYWGYRLTGVAATDVTSLGCHTDLWNPAQGALSSLVDRLGIREKIAPPRPSAEVLGPILPQVAARTGLAVGTPVHVGIHDSNASLLPHVLGRTAPFSVVSTGTWVVVMSVGGAPVSLDPARDTLINVNALGQPVTSARFMGGREFDLATGGRPVDPSEAEIADVLERGIMLLPALVPEAGPFQRHAARWLPDAPSVGSGQRSAAASYHAALVTATSLDLVGHRGPVIVEGPFARNRAYLSMLGAVTGCPVVPAGSATGTSQGAALLVTGGAGLIGISVPVIAGEDGGRLLAYAEAWQRALG
ncbi:FGGY-family carbohydrate kinase [Maliponia aquimaris]|uniref:L-fuculokinase n=1 Tax=Maliponia aquimaris TaxID=1673631 RepID=A0A238KMT0_9RHOB|nr:FGGY-family carbohydrate kinase [Maliponia aquimaris]SMX44065.1 L-fuculokinase [Maliponia aquimaris]